MKTSDLKQNPANPRKITQVQLARLQRSISDFEIMMEIRPIIFDPETGIVLGGNQRLAAIQGMGIKEIPDSWVKPIPPGMTDAEKKEFILKDNSSYGEWDWDLLQEDFSEFDFEDFGIDISMMNVSKPKVMDDGYHLPELETITTNIQPGDIIQIGRHRILCADSTDPESYKRLMGGEDGTHDLYRPAIQCQLLR